MSLWLRFGDERVMVIVSRIRTPTRSNTMCVVDVSKQMKRKQRFKSVTRIERRVSRHAFINDI